MLRVKGGVEPEVVVVVVVVVGVILDGTESMGQLKSNHVQ